MPTYKTKAMVLKKTKLKEADLILTLLAENGSQIRCVAKGARKPGSRFSARLEVFSVVDLLLYKGKNLDTITEVECLETNEACRTDIEKLSYGAVMAELVEKTALEGQEMPVLFPITKTAVAALGEADTRALPFVTSAFLIKTLSFLGYKPSFDNCVICGNDRSEILSAAGANGGADASAGANAGADGAGANGVFSYSAGGWVCPECASVGEIGKDDIADTLVVDWVRALLGMKFSEILKTFGPEGEDGVSGATNSLAGQLLTFCEHWMAVHLGLRLKSLGYLSRLRS